MRKEDILEKETDGIFDDYEGGITGIHNAMDVYAKQECIEFKKWCDENEGVQGYANGRSLSIEELYAFYKTPSVL